MRRFSRYFAVSAVWAAFFAASMPLHAQTVRVVAPQRVTVKAEAVPLGDLLSALNDISPVGSLNLDPSERTIPVTIVLEDVSAIDAMWLVLKESKLDFMMSSKGIWAGRAKKALTSAAAAPAAAPTVEPGEPRVAKADEDKPERDDQKPDRSRKPSGIIPIPASILNTADLPRSSGAAAQSQPDVPRIDVTSATPAPGADEFGRDSVPVVPFTVRGDSVRIDQAGFIPYKLLPEVVKRRLSLDLTKIP